MSSPIIDSTSYDIAIQHIISIASSYAINNTKNSQSIERVQVNSDIIGRISYQEVTSPIMLPAFDNSAMDGFVIHAADTITASKQHPIRFNVLSTIFAGDKPLTEEDDNNNHNRYHHNNESNSITKDSYQCYEIMTGAPFPLSSYWDTVVPVEEVEILGYQQQNKTITQIAITRPVSAGQHRRLAGEDMTANHTVIIAANSRITAEHILALSAVGIKQIQVYRPLHIGIISTGKEIHRNDQIYDNNNDSRKTDGDSTNKRELDNGQIYDANTPYMIAVLESLGCRVTHIAHIADNIIAFKSLLTKIIQPSTDNTDDSNAAINSYDILISSGAVSAGKSDFIARGLQELSAEIHFHHVAIKPAHPILFASLPKPAYNHNHTASISSTSLSTRQPFIPYFGLPGNPIAAVIGLRFFVLGYIRAIFSLPQELPMNARLTTDIKKANGIRTFYKAHLALNDSHGLSNVNILAGQYSFLIHPLLQANVWAVGKEEDQIITAGQIIDVYPLQPSLYNYNTFTQTEQESLTVASHQHPHINHHRHHHHHHHANQASSNDDKHNKMDDRHDRAHHKEARINSHHCDGH